MKIIILIFANLILALSVFPCSDNEHMVDHPYENHEDHDNHTEDECSPFCICACCGIALPFEACDFENENEIRINVSHFFSPKVQFTRGFINYILRPPALS